MAQKINFKEFSSMVPKSFVQNQGLIFDDFSSENFEKKVKNLNK